MLSLLSLPSRSTCAWAYSSCFLQQIDSVIYIWSPARNCSLIVTHFFALRRALNAQVIPYAAVAAALSEPAEGEHRSATIVETEGLAFCSLPVTVTGLPVHVNGALPVAQQSSAWLFTPSNE
jgi:hypothetical protein